jgi:hypothetical protein
LGFPFPPGSNTTITQTPTNTTSLPQTEKASAPTPDAEKSPEELKKQEEEAKKTEKKPFDDLDAIRKQLDNQAADIAKLIAITAILANPPDKNLLNPNTFDNAVRASVCSTTAPGGCTTKALQPGQDAAKNAETAAKNAENALKGIDLSLLAIINNKLGPQIPGGISTRLLRVFSGVQRMWDMLQVDRILNTLSWIGILHNALMLSNSLGTTLFGVIDVWLNAVGFKLTKLDDEGKPEEIDAQQAVNSWTLNFANSIFGAENVAKLTLAWKKANRIYQAVTNGVQTLQNMFDAARSIAEETANNVGKIGNALKKAGTVVENAYDWMNERVTARSTRQRKFDEFIQGISGVENILSDIESIGSNVVEFQDGMKELTEARKEFELAKTDAQKFANNQAEASKLASKAPDTIGLAPQAPGE